MFEWEDRLRIALVAKIEEAINMVDNEYMQREQRAIFPFISDNTSRIMADAAIAVLKGVEDAQEFLREDGLLDF